MSFRSKGIVFGMFFCIFSSMGFAMQNAERDNPESVIQNIQQQVSSRKLSMQERLREISSVFLDKPYFWGALGEGKDGEYDQFPLYRTDMFDCLTFVETVLAIALSQDFSSFLHSMNAIRYRDGRVSFEMRNHFTDLDWNLNNQNLGILKDITMTIHDERSRPVYQIATASIDKASWFQHLPLARVRLIPVNQAEQNSRLKRLQANGKKFPVVEAKIAYIPLSSLFDGQKQPNRYLFQQIPEGAIIEIVRPNWDLVSKIGTHLNVSHLGFVFLQNNQLMFRNASLISKRVVDQPLVDYLREAYIQSPTIKGINIQSVVSR